MATMICPHCGKRIIKKGDKCPVCGGYIGEDRQTQKNHIMAYIVIVISLIIYGFVSYTPTRTHYDHTKAEPQKTAAPVHKKQFRQKLRGGYPACISKELFNEFTSAVVDKNNYAIDRLLNMGCIITKPGTRISVIDQTWTGIVKLRAFTDDSSVILFTNRENIYY